MTAFLIMAVLVLCVNIALALVRLALSRTTPERVVALDTINTIVIAVMVLCGAAFRKALYVDVGIVYGLISFVGTLYIATILERRG